jgi:site-specific DNA recombinase
MHGRNGTTHRYYYCRNHDLLRAGSEDLRCPERNIRANELDEYIFAQVRQALLDPQALIAGEHAVITGTPIDENDLIANQTTQITNAIAAAELERSRLLDAYQAGLLELDELTRRTTTVTTRREQLLAEKNTLAERNAELATENRLRRGLASFAERIAASLDELDPDARQRLMRLVIEKVRVTGWRVEIHLKIPLADQGLDDNDPPSEPNPEPRPSSDMSLRSLRDERAGVVQEPVEDCGRDGGVFEDVAPVGDAAVGWRLRRASANIQARRR